MGGARHANGSYLWRGLGRRSLLPIRTRAVLELTLHGRDGRLRAWGLADQVNLAITALRDEVGENRAQYGAAACRRDIGICGSSPLLARHFGAGRKAHSRAVATLKADIQAWHPAGIRPRNAMRIRCVRASRSAQATHQLGRARWGQGIQAPLA